MTMNLADRTAKHISEWTEDDGPVIWWKFPLTEAPYIGSPLDTGHTVEVVTRFYHGGEIVEKTSRHQVGGWPGYHTHWTRFDAPTFWRKPERPKEET
jgi:hypothetical protein